MERKLIRSAFIVAALLAIILSGAASSFAETPKDAFMWLNHQSNMSLFVDVDKMDTVKSFRLAYASHAFMQLIREDQGDGAKMVYRSSGGRKYKRVRSISR